MSLTKSKVKSLVDKNVFPYLKANDFMVNKKKSLAFRVRDYFIDVITIESGRSPGSLYLHYFTNMLCNPFGNILSSYLVGQRLQGNEKGELGWLSETEAELKLILERIHVCIKDEAIPFFMTVENENAFHLALLKKLELRRVYLPFALAVSLSVSEKYDESIKVCEDIKRKIENDDDFDIYNNNEDKLTYQNINLLINANCLRSNKEQFDSWRDENMKIIQELF